MNLSSMATDSALWDLSVAAPLPAELNEMRLPQRHERADGVVRRAERQLDHVIDLLAAERTGCGTLALPNARPDNQATELSIVMPCHNNGDSVGNCVLKAFLAIERMGIAGEVIVADCGSRDDSVQIAEELGARIVHVDQVGYGAALQAGVDAARGRFLLIGNADDSYDFSQAPRFYRRLQQGADVVEGCRLPSGGGRLMPAAMPLLAQLGNRWLTRVARATLALPHSDLLCPVRAFRRDFYARYLRRQQPIEFGFELVLVSDARDRIEQEPIKLQATSSSSATLRPRLSHLLSRRVLGMCWQHSPIRLLSWGLLAGVVSMAALLFSLIR